MGCDLPERFYFKNKVGTFELAGIGEGCLIQGNEPETISDQLNSIWNKDDQIRVFGGMQFEPSTDHTDEWSGFGVYRFIVPFIEFCHSGDSTRVTLTCLLDGKTDLATFTEDIIQKLKKADSSRARRLNSNISALKAEKQIPEKAQWLKMVKKALAMIHRKEIGKIVLARKKVLKTSEPWTSGWIIRKLADVTESAFLFLFQPDKGCTFLGRTPERLFQLSENSLTVDAIAGTEPRGSSVEEDKQYSKALADSPKEQEEQQIVARYVDDKMKHLCTDARIEVENSILKLDKVQHLVSRFFGVPRAGLNPFETLLSLHPTPAVGVHPPNTTALIRTLEPFERGWYAGPIGWMNRHTAEFAVAIRSALIHKNELHIFAGAGIVAQSDPDREWQEIDDKMANFSFIKGARE